MLSFFQRRRKQLSFDKSSWLSRIRQNNITEAQNENQTGRCSANRYLIELENWLESRANDALDVLSDIRYPAITIMRTFSYFLIFFILVSSADMQAMSSL